MRSPTGDISTEDSYKNIHVSQGDFSVGEDDDKILPQSAIEEDIGAAHLNDGTDPEGSSEADPKKEDHGRDHDVVAAEEEEESTRTGFLTPKQREQALLALKILVGVLVVAYLLVAFIIDFDRALALFVITVLTVVYHLYYFYGLKNPEKVEAFYDRIMDFLERADTDRKTGLAMASFLVAIMVVIMGVTVEDGRNMVSLFGLLVYIGLTWAFSWKPRDVKLRPVLGGVFLQFLFGYAVIRTEWGFAAIEFLADIFVTLLGYTVAGSSFVFSWLTDGSLYGPFGTGFLTNNDDVPVLVPLWN